MEPNQEVDLFSRIAGWIATGLAVLLSAVSYLARKKIEEIDRRIELVELKATQNRQQMETVDAANEKRAQLKMELLSHINAQSKTIERIENAVDHINANVTAIAIKVGVMEGNR